MHRKIAIQYESHYGEIIKVNGKLQLTNPTVDLKIHANKGVGPKSNSFQVQRDVCKVHQLSPTKKKLLN